MNWHDALGSPQPSASLLFDATPAQWKQALWQPTDDDKTAAAKLHIQIVSRITTQTLGYRDGDEKTALTSVFKLFDLTRDIATAHPKAKHFEEVAWYVLNTHVRPFTAKWHRKSESGALAALDATDEFRADLLALQPKLREFDRVLLFIRDDEWPSGAAPAATPANKSADKSADKIKPLSREDEWKAGVKRGIVARFSGLVDTTQAADINEAEREAIRARRLYYKSACSNIDSPYAAGLAISGGGIRSATFALGVLVALADRNLLPRFDYLSTVSGGGYLGAFLSAFVGQEESKASETPKADDVNIGLCREQVPFSRTNGEAAALRHIRHHSKYLAVGTLWERLGMLTAQLYGMALNFVAVLWIMMLAVAAEVWLRRHGYNWTTFPPRPTIVLAVSVLLWVVALRFAPMFRSTRVAGPKWADKGVAAVAVIWTVALAWCALGRVHVWMATAPPALEGLGNKKAWLAVFGAIPVIRPVLDAVFPRLLRRAGTFLAVLTALAAPLFLIGLYLFLYQHNEWMWTGASPDSVRLSVLFVITAIGGFLVYVFLFDINATAPHRHYRRKLAQAFVIRPRSDSKEKFDEDVYQRISGLGPKAPYHLINCAMNVPASKNITMQGRLTDFFLLSPAFTGSPLLGYLHTDSWEAVDAHLDLATGMAISGAAAAPQMGTGTINRFTFWLALLNVRLGYWARNPGWKFIRESSSPPNFWVRETNRAAGVVAKGVPPGLRHLLKEMTGKIDESGAWINLSDGGHIENLGIYELLRRRCRFIVAIDGEEDAKMTFQGLTTLQRMAAIDLGVRIEIDLDDLRLTKSGLSRSHFRFSRIRYPKDTNGSEDEFGYLLYVKLSLTGNEGEFIRRYRLDEPAFPHQPTTDQFFSEAQFEAYRSLGEHIGNKLFQRAIVDDLADSKDVDLNAWFKRLAEQLLEPATSGHQ